MLAVGGGDRVDVGVDGLFDLGGYDDVLSGHLELLEDLPQSGL